MDCELRVAFALVCICQVLCFAAGVAVLAEVSRVCYDQPGVGKLRTDHAVCMLHALLKVYCLLSCPI